MGVATREERGDLDLSDGLSIGETITVGVLNNSGSKLSAESAAVFLLLGVRISRETPVSPALLRLEDFRAGVPQTVCLTGDRRDGVLVGFTSSTNSAGESHNSSLKLSLTNSSCLTSCITCFAGVRSEGVLDGCTRVFISATLQRFCFAAERKDGVVLGCIGSTETVSPLLGVCKID